MRLSDIFEIKYGGRNFTGIENSERGKIPVITSQGENNGICNFFDIKANYKNVISVSRTGSFCEAFYHDYDCYITDDCMVLTPKTVLSINEILWYVLLIRKNKYRFTYGRKITPSRLGEIIVPDIIPNYVKNIELPTTPSPLFLVNKEFELKERNWQNFKIGALFEVEKAKPLHKEYLENLISDSGMDRNVPYIARTQFNNGVVDYVCDNTEYISIKNKGNCIIIGGESVVAFYQKDSFYCGNNIAILRSDFLNEYNALFLNQIINLEMKDRFNYGRAANKERINNLQMKLPSTPQGLPDWEFIENYIKSLPYSKIL